MRGGGEGSAPGFGDHFSSQAGSYARHRPGYPPELYDWLASLVPREAAVWEVGAGSGQASTELAARFADVLATEPSLAQVVRGRFGRARLAVAAGEEPPLPDGSRDLAVAATAAHWLDMDRFAAAVRRVVRPGGAVVVWCYGETAVGPEVDRVVRRYRQNVVDPYWPPGREHVDALYRTLPFPFSGEGAPPRIGLAEEWSLAAFVGYLDTWSSLARYRRATGLDPLPELARLLSAVWGEKRTRTVRWPLAIRWARV